MNKTFKSKVVALSGATGAGKTTIAKMLEKFNFKMLNIDQFYLIAPRNKELKWFDDKVFIETAYKMFFDEILNNIKLKTNIVIETVGISPQWKNIIATIKKNKDIEIFPIHLQVDINNSIKRIEDRNKSDYPIKVDLDSINFFHSKVNEESHLDEIIINANQNIETVFQEIKKIVKI